MSCALFGATNPDPRANATQIFEDKRALRVFGLGNNLLADAMILVCLKPTLLSSQLFQAALGRAGANRLQGVAATCIPVAHALNRLASMRFTIRIGGDVDDAQVKTQATAGVNRFWFLDFCGGNQIPLALHTGQIALAHTVVEQFLLARAAHERDSLASANCPDRHRGGFIGQNTVIECDRATRPEHPLRLLVELVGIGYFRNAPDDQLRTQPRLLTNGVIDQAVHVKLLERARLPRGLADLGAGGIGGFQRLAQKHGLFGSWGKLQLQG